MAAARALFEAADVSPLRAATAAFRQEGEIEILTDEECQDAELWRRADRAAARACCEGWALQPDTALLELDLGRPKPIMAPNSLTPQKMILFPWRHARPSALFNA